MARQPISRLPHALTDPADLLKGRTPAVFLDYDGTLTPIVERPGLAVLSGEARAAVRDLASRVPVAVISGRDRLDVESLVGLDGLTYAGSHGFDIRAPGLGEFSPGLVGDVAPLLARAAVILHDRLDDLAGVLIERKRFTLAAHYRLVAPDQRPRVAAAVAEVTALLPQLRAKPGKMVFELQPAVDWHKGKAVLWLLQCLGLDRSDVVPLFLGDDVTDEDAFRALRGRGVGIIVAEAAAEPDRLSAAGWRLDDPGQVLQLLKRIKDL